MKSRWVLVIGDDKVLSDLVAPAVVPLGFEVEIVTDPGNALEKVVDRYPELVFIAADLPDRRGFALCDEIKDLDGAIRVVLAAPAISTEERDAHEKQPGRADLYLETRDLTEPELSRATAELLGLPVSVGLDTGAMASDPVRREFTVVRRLAPAARSAGNLALHERVDDKDNEIARLQQELLEREQRIVAIQQKRRKVVGELTEALRESRRSYRDIEVLLVSAQSELDLTLRANEDGERLAEMETQEYSERLAQSEERRLELENLLADAKSRVADVHGRADGELAALKLAHASALDALQGEHRQALQRGLDALTAQQAAAQAREHELRRQHDEMLLEMQAQARRQAEDDRRAATELAARFKAEKEQELSAAQAARAQAVAAQDREHAAVLRRLTDEKGALRAALHQKQEVLQQFEARIAEAESHLRAQADQLPHVIANVEARVYAERDQVLSALQASHAQVLSAIDDERRQIQERTAEQIRGLEATGQVREQALQQSVARLADLEEKLLRQTEEHQRTLVTLQAGHAQAIAALEPAMRAREGELRQQYEAKLGAVEARHLAEKEQEQAAAQAARTQALAAQDREHAAALRQAAEEKGVLKATLQQKQEQARQLEARLADMDAQLRKELDEHQAARAALEAAHTLVLAARDAEHQAAAQRREQELRQQYEPRLAEVEARARTRTAALEATHAQALAALESGMQAREQEIRQQYEVRLAQSEQQARQQTEENLQALAALEAHLRAEKDQEVAAAHAARAQALTAQDKEYAAALRRAAEEVTALRTSLKREQDAAAALDATHVQALFAKDEELKRARQNGAEEIKARLTEAEAQLRQQADAHQRAVEALEAAHVQAFGAFESAMRTREQEFRQQYEARLAEVQREADARVAEHQQAAAAFETRLRAEREQQGAGAATLEAAHAQALAAKDDEVRQARQGSADELQRYRSAAESAEQERKALHAAAQQREHELREQHGAWVARAEAQAAALETRLRAEKDQAVAAVEGRLRAEKDQDVTAAQAARVQALAAQDKEHAAALRQAADEIAVLKAALIRDQEAAAAGEAAHQEALAAKDEELRQALQRAAEEQKAQQAAAQRLEHEQRERHEARVAKAETQGEKRAAALEAAHAQVLAVMEDERRHALQRSAEELKQHEVAAYQREQQVRQQYEARLAALELQARRQADEHQRAAAALEARLRAEKEQELAAAQAARVQALAAQDKEHTAAIRRAAEELKVLKAALVPPREPPS